MSEIISTIILVCSLITSIAAVVGIFKVVASTAQAPNKAQNARLDSIEADIKKIFTYLDNDKNRIDNIEEGNVVTQRALLALVQHSIDGNNIEQLKGVKTDIEEYLITRKTN